MAREEQNGALALVEEVAALDPNDPRFERPTLLPPPPAIEDYDLIGPTSGIISLAALEAALDSLPFSDVDDVMINLSDDSSRGEQGIVDELPECERPTKRYTIPDVPPCMRATSRPDALSDARAEGRAPARGQRRKQRSR